MKNICSVSQKAYLVYHKQFCLSRTFFILFSSFFRNLVAYHLQQQFIILSKLSVHVKQFFIFLNFFLEIRVAFVRRNSHKVYQDCLSMSSSFCIFNDSLKSFHINKTLKRFSYGECQRGSLKFFRINKTLKRFVLTLCVRSGLKSFRINKTLKLNAPMLYPS